jgi:hypothetical protein
MRFHEILDEKYSLERRTLHFGPIFGEPRKLLSRASIPFYDLLRKLKERWGKGCIPSGCFQKKIQNKKKYMSGKKFYEKWENIHNF